MLSPRTVAVVLALTLLAGPAASQSSSGAISGRITDSQHEALRDATVYAENVATGFVRSTRSDRAGMYRLAGLPAGAYVIAVEERGFRPLARLVTLRIERDIALDLTVEVAGLAESVRVTAATPLISTRSSAVGEAVDLGRINGLPLNGRQFANLAGTVPGVGVAFHSDSTKSTQYAPQISGGNGRNINYVVDGGDNNDDTVGGLLQLFPLEAVQEFTLLTQRFDAEYGRSSGAVLNVVTKSGTNQPRGSWFTLARDDAMNAQTFTEKLANVEKQGYQRYQFGGSLGGPIVRNRTHYFAAYERTRQDMKQVVDTRGIFPDEDGIFDVPFREHLFTAKVTTTLGPRQYLALRYGGTHNSQLTGAGPTIAHSAWATSTNAFHSVNANHNWVIGPSLLNEAVVQFSHFVNDTPANSTGPSFMFFQSPVRGGTSLLAPQRTEQIKWHVRNDLSWTTTGGVGLSHELRGGVNWVHEPRLQAFAGTLTQGLYVMLEPSLTGPVQTVQVVGGNPTENFPLEHYGIYIQDDWRVTDRLTFNLGIRWDYVEGFPIDQSGSPNFRAMQLAGASGRFEGTLLDDFGQAPRPDRDNVQPRFGAVFDLFGNGRDVIRGGWGLYTDFGYIASNVLSAAFDGQAGNVFLATDGAGLRKADGSFFRYGDSLDTIAFRNGLAPGPPISGEVVSPRLEQPYTRQANLGWSHQFGVSTVVSADYVRVDGRDLNMRLRPNVRISGPVRLLDGVGISPNSNLFRTVLSQGSSQYDGLILAFRRRLSDGIDASVSYTAAQATSDIGTAYDEIVQTLIQDIRDPFGPVQQGPSARTDSRHMISISGIVRAPWDVQVAPIFHYRSALPVHTFEGVDLNGDSINNDRTAVRYRYTGIGADNRATFEEDGLCETVNCSRRAGFSQLNLRISRAFPFSRVRIEAIAEVFNLFNARNPSLAITQSRMASDFMQPNAYAGDIGQPEQRVGQVGFRISF